MVPALRFRPSEIRRELIRPILSFGGLGPDRARRIGAAGDDRGRSCSTACPRPVQVASYRMGSYVETRFYPAILGPILTVQPALTAMHAMGSNERMRRTYFRMSRYLLWVFLFFTVPGMVYHRELWDLYLGADIVRGQVPGSGHGAGLAHGPSRSSSSPTPCWSQVALAKAKAGAMALRVLAIEGSTACWSSGTWWRSRTWEPPAWPWPL